MHTSPAFTPSVHARTLCAAAGLALALLLPAPVLAQEASPAPAAAKPEDKPDFRPWSEVGKGFEPVPSTDDNKSFYALFIKRKEHQLLAELPRGFEGQRHFIALTIASGEEYAGLQFGEMYVYWKRVHDRLLLIEPNIGTRSTGDQESKSSVENLFTDRVIIDVPILAMGPSGQPVIDMRELLVARASTFFGGAVGGANTRVAQLKKSKPFERNVEIAWEMPVGNGRLKEFHYSISLIRDNPAFKPRKADERVGYFTTVYRDLGKVQDKDKWVRYVNRWHLEKRDPSLRMSPPKEPIVFYIDSAVPVKYRQAVREGVLEWNKAFEQVGIINAVEVYQQDQATGAHMDKDPENVKFNFVRWLANDQGTAIGPSRVHPLTGEILDADIILTDGWIRYFWVQFNDIMPELAMEGMSPETLAWLETRPQWDPRIRLADPAQRPMLLAQRARKGVTAYGGHAIAAGDPALAHTASRMMGDHEMDGLVNRVSQTNGLCLAAKGKAFDMAQMRLALELLEASNYDEAAWMSQDEAADGDKKDEDKKDDQTKDKKKPNLLDGIPDWFVQPLLRDLVMHEVGHTLGLRHNFRASAQWDMDELASIEGKQPFTASVMDYTPINMVVRDGKVVGDVGMTTVGPYDMWAIEYGYTLEDPAKVLKRAGEEQLQYATDEDTSGPDPLARRYDFGKDPLKYAQSQMELARYHRSRLLDKFVKDGDSWSRVRRGYTITLGMQTRSLSMMANWLGGTFVSRDRKGDQGNRSPLTVVPAAQQRAALRFVLDNAFRDDSFGLTTDILQKMTVDKWIDEGGWGEASQEPTFPIHDRIGGIQASAMTMILNPTVVRRVFDNEFRVPSDQDALTLAELLESVEKEVWSELDQSPRGSTARKPHISSLRRGLQREYVDRMLDLMKPSNISGEAGKAVTNLVTSKLRALSAKLAKEVGDKGTEQGSLDPYSFAHLSEAKLRIDQALDAKVIYNTNDFGGFGNMPFFFSFGQDPASPQPTTPEPQQP
jgi:hypothetical protein